MRIPHGPVPEGHRPGDPLGPAWWKENLAGHTVTFFRCPNLHVGQLVVPVTVKGLVREVRCPTCEFREQVTLEGWWG